MNGVTRCYVYYEWYYVSAVVLQSFTSNFLFFVEKKNLIIVRSLDLSFGTVLLYFIVYGLVSWYHENQTFFFV